MMGYILRYFVEMVRHILRDLSKDLKYTYLHNCKVLHDCKVLYATKSNIHQLEWNCNPSREKLEYCTLLSTGLT